MAALRAAGLDPEQVLSPVELGALDHFHTGGFRASLVLRDLAQIKSEDRVLDIGAGLAGPARMLASLDGCDVNCIDLSEDYCIAASLLNRLTGLEDKIKVHQGSVLDMRFPDDSFDVVWMQNVGMNIGDKEKLYQEVHRVLKPNGRFAFQEMVAGETPTIHFPLPWAASPAEQFLVSLEDTGDLLAQVGLVADYFEDVSHAPLPELYNAMPEGKELAPLSLSAYVDDLAQKADNAIRSIEEDRVRLVRGVFRAKK